MVRRAHTEESAGVTEGADKDVHELRDSSAKHLEGRGRFLSRPEDANGFPRTGPAHTGEFSKFISAVPWIQHTENPRVQPDEG